MSFARPDPAAELAAAREELWAAEQALSAVCRRAARGQAGAAAVSACQHTVHVCLERVRRLEPDDPAPAA